ncbi:MAG: RIP metalloprotease RseP [Candidatus Accumulibacter sp.]|nr:RIP metalloprotease RseP [Accumulibacter sp.]
MNGFLYYLCAFALVLGVLIIFHEFGHYLVARWLGVKVLRFSVGFGRPIWSRRWGRDGTEWAIAAFPLGGYVKMLDEREGKVPAGELHRSFNRQSVWRRMAIVAAGPLANLLLAVMVYWLLFWNGTLEVKPVLGSPAAASAAAAAGIQNGELVRKIGDESIQTWQEMRWLMLRRASDQDEIILELINRQNEIAWRRLTVSAIRESGWEGDPLERLGLTLYRPNFPALIGTVTPNGAADTAGMLTADKVLAIDDTPVTGWSDVVRTVRRSPGKMLRFDVLRGDQRLTISITPSTIDERGQSVGRIGAGVRDDRVLRDEMMIRVSYDPLTAFGKGVVETWDKSWFTLRMIGKMLLGEVSWRNISGPVTIADYAGQSAKLGIDYYLKFLALVSISLGVLNLLPIPILDGGHLLYYLIEIVKRAPLSERTMEIGQQIGLALLSLLMAFAFYNDLNRLFSS